MTLKDLNEFEKEHFYLQELISHWIGYCLIVGMMVCMGASMATLLGRFDIGKPTGYLTVIAGLAGIEGIITQSRMRRTADMNLSPAAYSIVEWVVMALVIRILMYFWLGWGTFLEELAGVRTNFVMSFLTGEYIFTMLVALIAWGLARMYAEDLRELGDDKVLLMIRDGEVASNRGLTRQRITRRVLAIGFGLVLVTALSNLDYTRFSWDMFQVKFNSVNLVVYFVMGLLLMSLAHFAALRAAWAWERIPIDSTIGRRWVLNSLFLLTLIGLAAFLLPARYSVGLLEAVAYIFYIFSLLIYGIILLIQLPIFAIIAVASRLFGTSPPQAMQRVPTPPSPPTEAIPQDVPEWSLIFRSILFWTILVIVIVFAVIQYIRQNQGLVQAVKNRRGWRLILQAFAWLKDRLIGLRSTVTTMVENGAQILSNLVRGAGRRGAWNYVSLRSLTPKQRVRFYYLALLRRSSEVGIARQDTQTPYEYAQTLAKEVNEDQRDVAELTEAFIEARYSNHPISTGQVSRVRQAWEALRKVLKEKKNVNNR